MGAVRLPKSLVLTIDDVVSGQAKQINDMMEKVTDMAVQLNSSEKHDEQMMKEAQTAKERFAARPAPSPSPYSVPGLPHVMRIELRQALFSHQDYHVLLLTFARRP